MNAVVVHLLTLQERLFYIVMSVTILIVSSKHPAFGAFYADIKRHKQTYKSGIRGRLGFCSRLRQGGDNASEDS